MIFIFCFLLAIFISIPLWTVSFECLVYLFLKKEFRQSDKKSKNKSDFSKVVILIPAHNEERVIGGTLDMLKSKNNSLKPNIVVIADNCTDKTAEIAKQFNVTVLARNNKKQLGKGYALDYGIQFIKKQWDIDVLVILDADCFFKAGSLEKLVNTCLLTQSAVQSLYMMRFPAKPSLKQRIAGFAWLVKNKIRPHAVSFLKFPITMTGTGMAFPGHLLDEINLAHGHIVEDMQLGIDLAIKGYPPVFCSESEVYSYFPEQLSAQKTQRTRWEHGHLLTIFQQLPKMLAQAFLHRDFKLCMLALDLSVPPLALLVLIALSGIVVLFFALLIYNMVFPLAILVFSCLVFFLSVLLIWWREGRTYLGVTDLLAIPFYILSKVGIYFNFIFNRQKDWVRTGRGE